MTFRMLKHSPSEATVNYKTWNVKYVTWVTNKFQRNYAVTDITYVTSCHREKKKKQDSFTNVN